MNKNNFAVSLSLLFLLLIQCTDNNIGKDVDAVIIYDQFVQDVVSDLVEKHGIKNNKLLERGVEHASSLWRASDGTSQEFQDFCMDSFIADEDEKVVVLNIISKNLESLWGHNNKIILDLKENMDLDRSDYHNIDVMFAGYSPSAHFADDFYTNKIAFVIALNFPPYSLDEKNQLGKNWNSLEWAYARLGDVFTERVPAEISQNINLVGTASDRYISEYNIYMGHLLNDAGQQIFPDDMVLLSHWNLRDELKANYINQESGFEKQEMIYSIMNHIINQTIPEAVINSNEYEWNPISNKVFQEGEEIQLSSEPNTRYQQILDNFNANKAADIYYTNYNTFIKRAFAGSKEIPQEAVERLFDEYLSSPIVLEVGELIKKKLGRDLKPFDIWYDGFKARSSISEETLSRITSSIYPTAQAFEADLVNILEKLGWDKDRAEFISSKVVVDEARGSGHAWGAQMRDEKAHLRTRISKGGMDYKGYNIAVHEFGHNVEQTISLHEVDHYMIEGVPNTAFTEALAFIFQKQDLQLLGIITENPQKEYLETIGLFWNIFEIMGVSMVDMKVWKWLYENPDADAAQLKDAVVRIAKDVWNDYFAKVCGVSDEPILAVYSHMISYPLYLANYSFGHLIDFQIEQYLSGKDFTDEIDRIWSLGQLTPQIWMEKAIGQNISIEPMISYTQTALEQIK